MLNTGNATQVSVLMRRLSKRATESGSPLTTNEMIPVSVDEYDTRPTPLASDHDLSTRCDPRKGECGGLTKRATTKSPSAAVQSVIHELYKSVIPELYKSVIHELYKSDIFADDQPWD